MSKDLNISILMDFYGQLLTQKQLSTLDLYYNQDFSLAEIAQCMDITRQGVRDSIKRGEKQLQDFEKTLGLAKRFLNLSEDFSKMQSVIDIILENTGSDKIRPELEKLKEISDNIHKNL